MNAGRQRGVTLIELVVSIVVAGIAVGALTLVLAVTGGRSADPMILEQASAIAQAHLAEVTLKSFCDPDYDADADPGTPLDCPADCGGPVCSACRGAGAVTEAARPLYDDVCDYDGLSSAGVFDQTGAVVPGLDLYAVTVQVLDSGVALDTLTADSGRSARIDVSVTHPALPVPVTLSAWRANF